MNEETTCNYEGYIYFHLNPNDGIIYVLSIITDPTSEETVYKFIPKRSKDLDPETTFLTWCKTVEELRSYLQSATYVMDLTEITDEDKYEELICLRARKVINLTTGKTVIEIVDNDNTTT